MSGEAWGIILGLITFLSGGILVIGVWGYGQLGKRIDAKVNAELCKLQHESLAKIISKLDDNLAKQEGTLDRVDRRLLVVSITLGIKEEETEGLNR